MALDDSLHYKNRDGSPTGYKPNTKEPKLTAADNPRVGNPMKEAGKGSMYRPVDMTKYTEGEVWKTMGPEANKMREEILRGYGLFTDGEDYLWVHTMRNEKEFVEVQLNPKFCATCGLIIGNRFTSLMAVKKLMKEWKFVCNTLEMKPMDMPEKLQVFREYCEGDPVGHAMREVE
jgi:hypothetical protein